MYNQQGPTVQHMELCSILCGSLDMRGVWGRMDQFSSVQLLSRVRLFVTPWTAAHQASLSITNSRSLLKLMSIESVMPSNHLILCHSLLLPPSVFPSIRVFSNESDLCIRWPKDWTFREWIHVYIWLSHFPLHLKLSHFLLISYTSIQNKKF